MICIMAKTLLTSKKVGSEYHLCRTRKHQVEESAKVSGPIFQHSIFFVTHEWGK
jgi:hypothetical protein